VTLYLKYAFFHSNRRKQHFLEMEPEDDDGKSIPIAAFPAVRMGNQRRATMLARQERKRRNIAAEWAPENVFDLIRKKISPQFNFFFHPSLCSSIETKAPISPLVLALCPSAPFHGPPFSP